MSRTAIVEVLTFLGGDDLGAARPAAQRRALRAGGARALRGRGAARRGALDARPRREPGRRGRRAPAPPAAPRPRRSLARGARAAREEVSRLCWRSWILRRPRTPARRSAPTTAGSCAGAGAARKIHDAARALFREQGFDKTTLREIAARAGMGASSIYRHIRSQGGAAGRRARRAPGARVDALPRAGDARPARARAAAPLPRRRARAPRARARPHDDRAARHHAPRGARGAPRARAPGPDHRPRDRDPPVRRAARGELRRDADVLVAARTLTHAIHGARLAWANGLLDAEGCRTAVDAAVDLLFDGIGGAPSAPEQPRSESREVRRGDAPPDLLDAPRDGEPEEGGRDRRPAGRHAAPLELRRARGAREPARARAARARRGAARPRDLVRDELARRRHDGARRAQDRAPPPCRSTTASRPTRRRTWSTTATRSSRGWTPTRPSSSPRSARAARRCARSRSTAAGRGPDSSTARRSLADGHERDAAASPPTSRRR